MAQNASKPLANPAPLGLSGFALTTFLLSLINANIISTANIGLVFGLALAYGGVAQFAAGMWEFHAGNTFGATAFTSYGAFWLSFIPVINGFGLPKGLSPDATGAGWYLIGWGIFTGLMAIGSFRTNLATAGVFVLLFVTFILLGLGKLTGTSSIGVTGGFFGIATAIVAWYTALAGILQSLFGGKHVLPVFPLTKA